MIHLLMTSCSPVSEAWGLVTAFRPVSHGDTTEHADRIFAFLAITTELPAPVTPQQVPEGPYLL